MDKKLLFALLAIGLGILFIESCEVNGCHKGNMNSNGSSRRDGEKMKGNCMDCHGPNGNGSGCFTIAGTVYDSTQMLPNTNALIKFYTQPNGGGQLVATLDVDGSGNFFTTDVINFGGGLYPAVSSKTGNKVQYMPQPTVNGSCGSCHGILNPPVWIN